jgi:hypothetical protein
VRIWFQCIKPLWSLPLGPLLSAAGCCPIPVAGCCLAVCCPWRLAAAPSLWVAGVCLAVCCPWRLAAASRFAALGGWLLPCPCGWLLPRGLLPLAAGCCLTIRCSWRLAVAPQSCSFFWLCFQEPMPCPALITPHVLHHLSLLHTTMPRLSSSLRHLG